jgi:8-oxo-dGTP diphosphatase
MKQNTNGEQKNKKPKPRKGHWIPVVAGFLKKDGKIFFM